MQVSFASLQLAPTHAGGLGHVALVGTRELSDRPQARPQVFGVEVSVRHGRSIGTKRRDLT